MFFYSQQNILAVVLPCANRSFAHTHIQRSCSWFRCRCNTRWFCLFLFLYRQHDKNSLYILIPNGIRPHISYCLCRYKIYVGQTYLSWCVLCVQLLAIFLLPRKKNPIKYVTAAYSKCFSSTTNKNNNKNKIMIVIMIGRIRSFISSYPVHAVLLLLECFFVSFSRSFFLLYLYGGLLLSHPILIMIYLIRNILAKTLAIIWHKYNVNWVRLEIIIICFCFCFLFRCTYNVSMS